jgi:hypothetical protein
MGGNAIKSASRINKQQYDVAVLKLEHILVQSGTGFSVVPAYFNKETFGDIDVVIDVPLTVNQVKELFGATEIVKNSNVISFGFNVEGLPTIQVDLIYQSEETYEFAVEYFSFNDLGNLCGRLSAKMGMKFGHDGLWLPMRDGTNQFHEILLTQDFEEALSIIDLDYDRWCYGFADLTDIFEFVRSSKFFNSDIYLLDNRNTISRTRDSKRKTYMEFLKYNEKNPLSRYTFVKDKSFYLPLIFSHFPDAGLEYFNAMEEHRLKMAAKLMFNGDLVREWTGLEGKALGEFMKELKTVNPRLCDYRLVLEMDDEEIKTMVMTTFQKL